MTPDAPDSLRARGQLLPIVAVGLVVLMTLGNAAANMLPVHRPTPAELRAAEQAEIAAQRRARIAELRVTGDHCVPAAAHELVRLLVMDGQFADARAYASDHELRCGPDPVVRHWGDAPVPRHL